MRQQSDAPGPENGYAGAQFLRDTPYGSISEWSRAIMDSIPEDERCGGCDGRGITVLYASNGGPSEFPPCCICGGSRRKPSR